MVPKYFLPILLVISLLGLILRLHHYSSIPPFAETKDEFIYPWAGMSLLQTGVPETWSPFSYPQQKNVTYWGKSFTLVRPYIEKPFLYSLLTGTAALLAGQTEFDQVRLSTIRIIPIFLSVLTIFFLGMLGKKIFEEKTGLMAALIYAITPMIVIGNRLSVTENLLIPLSLAGLLLCFELITKPRNWQLHLLGVICVASILTKQIGIVLPLAAIIILFQAGKKSQLVTLVIYTVIGFLIHPLIAYFYDWQTYLIVSQQLKQAHALGLPEAIFTMFRFPGIGHKESIFLDGTMLLGTILLFASPLFLEDKRSRLLILLYPFLYLVLLVLGEGGQTWYGWHVFPLYPFIALIFAYGLNQIYIKMDSFLLLIYIICAGTGLVRWLLQIHSGLQLDWQFLLVGLFGSIGLLWLFSPKKIKPQFLTALFALYITATLYTLLQLPGIYPSQMQPIF